jgi:hypothetical protein
MMCEPPPLRKATVHNQTKGRRVGKSGGRRSASTTTEPEPATGSEVRPCKKVVYTCHESRVWKARAQFAHLSRLVAVDEQTVVIVVGIILE